MNTSNQSYKELAIPYFKVVFEIIDQIMIKHQIPYYLIGASAVALELLKSGIKPSRGTKDIDFAIMISSLYQFEDLSKDLDQKGFKKVKAPWTFYSDEYNIVIDLLPFGEIEENDTIHFTERNIDLHVLGFKEVMASAVKVEIEEKVVNVPPLPGMIILKLVSWSDRPEERENDLADILRIIEHYFDVEFDEIVEFHHDTFPEDSEIDKYLVGAEVIGRKAQSYLSESGSLSKRIKDVLSTNLTDDIESKICREWTRIKGWDLEYSIQILKAFEKGIMASN